MPVTIDELSNMAEFGGQRRPSRAGHVPARARAARGLLPGHLDRRPHRRAAAHVGRAASPRSTPSSRRASSRPTTAASAGSGRATSSPTSASTRSPVARRASTGSSRPASTRCAAARGTSTPASPTWTSTASGRACASRRSCPASSASASRSRRRIPTSGMAAMRAWNDWMLEEWCGPRPEPHDPDAAAVAPRPGGRGGGGPTERRARVQGRHVLGEPRQARAALDPHRLLGPVPRRVRGDRDRRLPARGLVVDVAVHDRGRTTGGDRRPLLRVRHVRRGRLALLADPRAVPRHQDLHVRGRHRLGGRADGPARPLLRLPDGLPAHVGRRRRCRRRRCSSETSGGARSTTRVRG